MPGLDLKKVEDGQVQKDGKAAITGSNWDTGHKITGKKRGKATISCTITNTNTTVADWVKGDIHKWIITVK